MTANMDTIDRMTPLRRDVVIHTQQTIWFLRTCLSITVGTVYMILQHYNNYTGELCEMCTRWSIVVHLCAITGLTVCHREHKRTPRETITSHGREAGDPHRRQTKGYDRGMTQSNMAAAVLSHTKDEVARLLPTPGGVTIDADHEAVVLLIGKPTSSAVWSTVHLMVLSRAVDPLIQAMLVFVVASIGFWLPILFVGGVAEGALEEGVVRGDAAGIDVVERTRRAHDVVCRTVDDSDVVIWWWRKWSSDG